MKTLEGLHLWKVSLHLADSSLWVTTRKLCMVAAMAKAHRFLSRHKTEYPGCHVVRAEYNGTIDA